MAENAPDSATEKSELQTTKQLIIESKKAGSTGSAAPLASNSRVNKQEDTKRANSTKAETSTSTGDQPAEQQSESKESGVENKTVVSATKEASVKAGSAAEKNKSSREEVAANTAKETASTPDVPETGSAANVASAVLDANTLHVDEAAVYSVSPKQVYTAANPIPMDPQLPEGFWYSRFRSEHFIIHALSGVISARMFSRFLEKTTRAGWIRYCVGMMAYSRTFEPANLVKMEMRST